MFQRVVVVVVGCVGGEFFPLLPFEFVIKSAGGGGRETTHDLINMDLQQFLL